ncbi:hypothetical protein IMAU80597_02859 [Lactiplantibacillus plantarum]|nr:hypothetical protein [Lactiplantibacillus plantarum]MCG0872937.1 hypothetical protein [Lactiplantibacillus plantarum]
MSETVIITTVPWDSLLSGTFVFIPQKPKIMVGILKTIDNSLNVFMMILS